MKNTTTATDEQIKALAKLKAKTNALIDEVCDGKKDLFDGPINWGDLSCHTAEIVIADDGVVMYRVVIEEAAPGGNYEFCTYIAEMLDPEFGAVEVLTEW